VEDPYQAVGNELVNKEEADDTYDIGRKIEWEDIKLVNYLCEKMIKIKGKDEDYYKN